jgi:Kef-type K+ transport system membrane component KefB
LLIHPLRFVVDAPLIVSSLGLIVVVSAVLAVLARTIKMPTIVVYIFAGLLLGPITGWLTVDHTIEIISEVGIALLLFLVGLELSLDKIRDVGKVAVAAGIGQVVFTALGGYAIAWALGFTVMEGIFISVALTFSSTVVVVKLLSEKNEINATYGRIAVGIFLVQDIVVIVALTFLAGLATPEDLEAAAVGVSVAKAFGGMLVLLAAALLAAKYVLPYVFEWLSRSVEAMFIWGLFWCFILVLAAEWMALSIEIGAFLAGLSLAQLPFNHELKRRVHPLVNFFIAVFFVSLGVQMELEAAQAHWLSAIVLSLFVLIGNPFIFMFIIARFGYGERTSFLTSVTVAQISEFSFIFAAMGLAAGLIDETILSLVAVVGLVTIAVSSYMIFFNHQLYGVLGGTPVLQIFGAKREDDVAETEEVLSEHVIVVGMNTLGHTIARKLTDRGFDVVAVDTDIRKLSVPVKRKIVGDALHPEILDEAGFSRARLLVSALQIEETNNMLAYRCRLAGIPCSIHAFDRSVIDDLNRLGVTHMIRSKDEGLSRVMAELREQKILRA